MQNTHVFIVRQKIDGGIYCVSFSKEEAERFIKSQENKKKFCIEKHVVSPISLPQSKDY